MRLHLLIAAIVLYTGAAAVGDDSPAPNQPKPVPRARWSEDWSVLREPASIHDTSEPIVHRLLRPIKNIPLGESADFYLNLGGEYRLAYELYGEADMGISEVGFQDALQHRLALDIDLHFTRWLRFFAELGGAAVNDREGGAKPVDESNINFWQLFADGRVFAGNHGQVVLRLGRQYIETANVFITAGEAHNVRLTYDGGRIAWLREGFVPFEAFGAEYVDYADGAFDMSGTGEYFWGLRTGMRLEPHQLELHLLYLGWDLKERQFEQGGADRHDELRHTLMLWLDRPLVGDRQWGLNYYLAYQFGRYDDRPGGSDISAVGGFGWVRYAFFPQANTPIVGLKTSYFSGDRDPGDDALGTFYNPVFGTPYFSYARDIMPFNLIHLQPEAAYRFGDRLLATLSYGLLWRAKTNDAYYNSANGILVRAGVSDSRWLGQQTQLGVRYRPISLVIINAYWSHFFAGDVIRDAGGSDRDYFHVGVNLLF
jgi:hypothetical protein